MQSCSPTPAIDRVVAEARARAQLAARLLRRLDPFRTDPRIARVEDLCAVLTGDALFREDTLAAIETLAARVLDKRLEMTAQPRPHPTQEALETLYAALLDTVEAARALDALLLGEDGLAAGTASR